MPCRDAPPDGTHTSIVNEGASLMNGIQGAASCLRILQQQLRREGALLHWHHRSALSKHHRWTIRLTILGSSRMMRTKYQVFLNITVGPCSVCSTHTVTLLDLLAGLAPPRSPQDGPTIRSNDRTRVNLHAPSPSASADLENRASTSGQATAISPCLLAVALDRETLRQSPH